LRLVGLCVPVLDAARCGALHDTRSIHHAADTLWLTERDDPAEVIERNLREKTVATHFRFMHASGHLSLARIRALRGALDEAAEWFDAARASLEGEGARPPTVEAQTRRVRWRMARARTPRPTSKAVPGSGTIVWRTRPLRPTPPSESSPKATITDIRS